MPIYHYRCENGHEFEVMQRMSEDALDACEVCSGVASRLLFAPAIHFKGSGFHNTDYGTRRRPAAEDGASSTAGDGTSSNGTVDPGTPASTTAGSGSSSKTVGLDKV